MRIGVFGATGRLGRRVVDAIATPHEAVTIIARRPEALAHLAEGRPSVQTAVADAADAPALARAFDGCGVLLNCAPAATCGEVVVRAALAAGAHYVDAAGEQAFIRRVFDEFGDAAIRRGTAVVVAMGFDYAIGDCLARLAADGRGAIDDVLIAYFIDGGDVARNSAEAASAAPGGQEVVYRNRRWRPVPLEIDRAAFDFPPPFGRQPMSRYGSGEVITVPRHTDTRSVRTLITSRSLCPSPALLPLFPIVRPLVGVLRRTPARALLRTAARVAGPAPAAAPGPIAADATRRFAVVAEARAIDGSVGRAVATGFDFHDVTAALLAQAARWLTDGHAGGVFSAATAFEAARVLDSLAAQGVRWSVERGGAVRPRPTR